MSESVERVRLASPTVGREERERVESVLASGQLASGDEVKAFQAEFADFCQAEHAVATANGTAALHTALAAGGIGPGDTVVTSPFSFIASANAIRFVGAEPAFVDIDPATYTLDPAGVDRVLQSKPEIDAILAVHLYGLPAPVDQLAELASDHDVRLIEDAAQAHGASIDGQPVGTFGDVGCFSFYPTKNMTTGEGGMVVTDDGELADRAARFINHGRAGEYHHVELGYNYRMTDIAAAIGRVQLDRLPAINVTRRAHAEVYDDGLAGLPVKRPVEPRGYQHVYNQYTIRMSSRDELRSHLDSAGIETGVYYPETIHRQPPYRTPGQWFPSAEQSAREVLSLPVHPELSSADLIRVIDAIEEWAS
jgi:dTDP-4-amino-4,6-dideoxygalactose transaminase